MYVILSHWLAADLPTEHTQDEVEHEEAAHHDERDEKDPVEGAADGVVGLDQSQHDHFQKTNTNSLISWLRKLK